MKGRYLQLLLFISLTSFSQDFKTGLKVDGLKDAYQISDASKNRLLIFVKDSLDMKAFQIDDQFQVISHLATTNPDRKLKEIIGHSSNGNSYTIFFATRKYKKIVSETFNFDTKAISSTTTELDLSKEEYLTRFSSNNQFYLITKPDDVNDLKFYVFTEAGNIAVKTIHLLDYKIEEETNTNEFNKDTKYSLIQLDTPYSLVESACKRKIYPIKEFAYLTYDNKVESTKILKLNLNSFAVEAIDIRQAILANNTLETYSNSILMDDGLIIQMKTNPKEFKMALKDFSGSVIKDYLVNENQEINFKNSDIIRLNGSGERVLDKTSQYLSKICDLYVGMSCFKNNDRYHMTIGGVSEPRSSGGMMMAPMMINSFSVNGVGMTTSSFGSSFSYFNYNTGASGAYGNRKLVYINSVFDLNFEHLEGKMALTAHDKINDFIDANPNFTNYLVMHFNSKTYLGFYDDRYKEYTLLQF